MTPRKNNPKSRDKDIQKDKNMKDKVKQETGEKISKNSEHKARPEAETKSKEIIQQAEDKAQLIIQQAEDKAQLIIQQAEDKARPEAIENRDENQDITKIEDYYPQGEPIKLKESNYYENDKSSNPFMPGISLWQDYAKVWMDLSKEITSNTTTKMIRYFENTNEKS